MFSEKKTDDREAKLLFYIKESLKKLYDDDQYLIMNHGLSEHRSHVSERAIVFRFGIYFQGFLTLDSEFKDYNLDCEYNRNGDGPKYLEGEIAIPDMILHKRGSNDDNIMVIEFKSYWNRDQKHDIEKVLEFTREGGTYEFEYGLTILLEHSFELIMVRRFHKGKRYGTFLINSIGTLE